MYMALLNGLRCLKIKMQWMSNIFTEKDVGIIMPKILIKEDYKYEKDNSV